MASAATPVPDFQPQEQPESRRRPRCWSGRVAYLRLVFRQGQKERLVRAASVMAIGGLAAVALAVSAAVLLVTSYVGGGLAARLITGLIARLFGFVWVVFPLARRR